MNPLSQDSSVTSSEESRMKKENSVMLLDKVNHLVDSSSIDRVSSPAKYEFAGTPSSDDSKLTKSFPWITDFSKLCQTEIGLTKIHSLENLMTEYVRDVSVSVLECHLKPNRAAKLKKTMNGTLLLFHLFYSDIKKPLEHSSYLDKMSDLMAMYIDMEITASSRSKESLFKIASKLTSSLFIFLDRSHDHILDSIFKTKYMNKNFWELCNLIFVRVLRESPGRAVCDMTYVRYVLAFKMWKRVVKGVDEKRNVMKLATMRLHPPPHFRESVRAGIFSGILPKIPKSRNDITMFLMQAKFCIKEKTNAFLKQVTNSEKCGALSSYMTNFDRIPFSVHNDTDDSRLSSEEDQEDNCGNSSALMNNIWSSMSGESGVAHQIRMANIIKGKKQKSKCKKAKCKGIATPVFKTNAQQCGDSLEKLKKKRRLQQMGELAAIKPLPTSILAEKSTSPSNVTMVRPRIGTPASVDTGAVQVSNVESCQSPSVSDVKREPGTDIWLGDCKEQVNRVDSVYQGDKADDRARPVGQQRDGSRTTDAVSSVPSPTVRVDGARPTVEIKYEPSVGSRPDDETRTPRDGSSDRSTEDRVRPRSTSPRQDTAAYRRAALEITVAQSLINFSQSSQHDPKQEFIKKTVEKIQESGRRFHKSQIKVQKLHTEPEQNVKPKPPEAQKQNQEQGTLHDQTLRSDYNIFTSQHLFRSNILNNGIPQETRAVVPSPYDSGDGSEDPSERCTCVQCSANQTALVTNYKILTQYLESKQSHDPSSIGDKTQDPDPTSCLPFKKRKKLPMDSEEEERDTKVTPGTRDNQVSYPNTPMISIAMLDPKTQLPTPSDPTTIGTTSLPAIPSAIDYSVSNIYTMHASPYIPVTPGPIPDPVALTVAVERHKKQSPLLPPSTSTIISTITPHRPTPGIITKYGDSLTKSVSGFKPKFKTPAQLKQCPGRRPSDEIEMSLAQNTSHCRAPKSGTPSTQKTTRSSANKQKQKPVKVDKNLRKRKY